MTGPQRFWIGVIVILSLLFAFLAPVIPVEGSQTFLTICGKPVLFYANWNYTDRQSVGYRFLGVGYSLRHWHPTGPVLCARVDS